jgi:hypothetical protein
VVCRCLTTAWVLCASLTTEESSKAPGGLLGVRGQIQRIGTAGFQLLLWEAALRFSAVACSNGGMDGGRGMLLCKRLAWNLYRDWFWEQREGCVC